jgi:hypothetical protein
MDLRSDGKSEQRILLASRRPFVNSVAFNDKLNPVNS